MGVRLRRSGGARRRCCARRRAWRRAHPSRHRPTARRRRWRLGDLQRRGRRRRGRRRGRRRRACGRSEGDRVKVSDRDRGHAGAVGHRPSQRLACRHQVGREGARRPAEGAAAAVGAARARGHAERAAVVEQEHSTAAAGAEAARPPARGRCRTPPPPPPAPPRRRRAASAARACRRRRRRARGRSRTCTRSAWRRGARRTRRRSQGAAAPSACRARGGGVAPAVDGAVDRERRRVPRARRELEDADAAEHALLHEAAARRRDAVRRGERREVEGAGGDLADADAVEVRARCGVFWQLDASQPSQPQQYTTPPPSGQSAAEWCLPAASALTNGRLARWRGAHSSCRPPWPSAPIRPEPQLNAAPPSLSASVCSSPQHTCSTARPASAPPTAHGDCSGTSRSPSSPVPRTPERPRPQVSTRFICACAIFRRDKPV